MSDLKMEKKQFFLNKNSNLIYRPLFTNDSQCQASVMSNLLTNRIE